MANWSKDRDAAEFRRYQRHAARRKSEGEWHLVYGLATRKVMCGNRVDKETWANSATKLAGLLRKAM